MVKNFPTYAVLAVIAGGVVIGAWRMFGEESGHSAKSDVVVPPLSGDAALGKAAFDRNCAECHGGNASGTGKGPPLVHQIYNPGHHADEAFFRAAEYGVRQHHWPYGNMPAQPQVSHREVARIVEYVRALQKANGIVYQPHRM
ncbi:mono/diheme cytochrome c family protein [Parvibaculum indicum]|uniref:c-type cytochrome n=1 Tax=Parvibaculum indicum TaxID=562969 RepID=UPI00141FE3A1|nr:cytochrome c [Parvibaculum indicum]NIJ43390.1 mono/diheme cytochrome c family protein [Parvibaculum indicum]